MNAPRRPEKRKLSKSILEMKFMKKSKEKAHKDLEEEEGRAMFASDVTEAMRKGGNKFVVEPSFVPCEGLIMGRLSYNGMNPGIERLMQRERGGGRVVELKEENREEVEVTQEEMAETYTTLVGTVGKKFQKKSERKKRTDSPARKKPRFLKPEDD